MSWVEELCALYDKNKDKAGIYEERRNKNGEKMESLLLLPFSHTTVKAQITVTIDSEGNFKGACIVPKEDSLTLIPVTDASAVRTSGITPHPLSDNLKYLDPNYTVITGSNKNLEEYNKQYMEQLEKWAGYANVHPKVTAIYKYLKKTSLISDLIGADILKLNEKGVLAEAKIEGIAQSDAFVRFEVYNELEKSQSIQKRTSVKCWLDKTLIDNYIEYSKTLEQDGGLCYLLGKTLPLTWLQPGKIRNEGDRTKLISANDESGLTYRGRFNDEFEAFSVSFEASQKAHNALKWIIRKQGYTKNDLCIVTWESDLKEIPDWNKDTYEICKFKEEEIENTNSITANQFNKAIESYQKEIKDTSKMVVMALDAATTGRLSLTYYQELDTSRYLENIKYWHNSMKWEHIKWVDKQRIIYEGVPSILSIAEALYGDDSAGYLSVRGNTKVIGKIFKRLLPCVINTKPIPYDLVNLSVHRASSPVSFSKEGNWDIVLRLACSMVRKQIYEREGEEWQMALNLESRDRNYLYGRLLAVADTIEEFALRKEEGGRQTNAKRYMNVFSQRPFRTWQIIEEKLEPYIEKLPVGSQIYYRKALNEIMNMFNEEDFKNDAKLDGLYLLGYHCQSTALKTKKEKEEE